MCYCSQVGRRGQNFYFRNCRSKHLLDFACISTDFVGCTCLCCRTLTRSGISLLTQPLFSFPLLVNYWRRSTARSGSIRGRRSKQHQTNLLARTAGRFHSSSKSESSVGHACASSSSQLFCCQAVEDWIRRSQRIDWPT